MAGGKIRYIEFAFDIKNKFKTSNDPRYNIRQPPVKPDSKKDEGYERPGFL